MGVRSSNQLINERRRVICCDKSALRAVNTCKQASNLPVRGKGGDGCMVLMAVAITEMAMAKAKRELWAH